MRRCRNRKNGIQNNKETGAIGCILSRRFLLLFVFPVPDKDTAKKTVDKYKVGVCFLNGTLESKGFSLLMNGANADRTGPTRAESSSVRWTVLKAEKGWR